MWFLALSIIKGFTFSPCRLTTNNTVTRSKENLPIALSSLLSTKVFPICCFQNSQVLTQLNMLLSYSSLKFSKIFVSIFPASSQISLFKVSYVTIGSIEIISVEFIS